MMHIIVCCNSKVHLQLSISITSYPPPRISKQWYQRRVRDTYYVSLSLRSMIVGLLFLFCYGVVGVCDVCTYDEALASLTPGSLITPLSNPQAFEESSFVWGRDTRTPFSQAVPSLIIRPQTQRDVEIAVRYAFIKGHEIAVKSGGHGAGGRFMTRGGLLIDMKYLNQTTYDPISQTLTVGGGTLIKQITDYMVSVNRSPVVGMCSGPGAGLIHGGWSILSRKVGLLVDNIVSLDMTFANGTTSKIDATSDPDIWWAVRGAAPNFGVISSLTYKTYDVTPSLEFLFLSFDGYTQFSSIAKWLYTKKDDVRVGSIQVVMGQKLVWVVWFWDTPGLREAFAAANETNNYFGGTAYHNGTGYFNFQNNYYDFSLTFPNASFAWWRSGGWSFSGNVTDDNDFLDTYETYLSSTPGASALLEFWGGAIADVPLDATPFYPRRKLFQWTVSAFWRDYSQSNTLTAKINDAYNRLLQFQGSSPALYINYVVPTPENIVNAYGSNYARLQAIKDRYDPTNFFHLNFNIPPSGRTTPQMYDVRPSLLQCSSSGSSSNSNFWSLFLHFAIIISFF
eukprot:TRINITY_DN4878_c0_g2_i3.p1 TRINITY_DN4878_c0_g2~~TRINITY_DN4878_c0_g2_i3.p1  ORF type:complete len:565 (+),score=53.67 TRINITY_DN4878_c0_g2_i3:46-1740(+)